MSYLVYISNHLVTHCKNLSTFNNCKQKHLGKKSLEKNYEIQNKLKN